MPWTPIHQAELIWRAKRGQETRADIKASVRGSGAGGSATGRRDRDRRRVEAGHAAAR